MIRASLRAVIDAKCRDCIYDPGSGEGGWRQQVQACCSANCPLHSVRQLPVKATKTGGEALQAASSPGSTAPVGSALQDQKVGSNDHKMEERRAA
jgi:hypothetical protein